MVERKRILVVEDDEPLRRTLERCLARENCEVVTARDGVDGIEKIESGPFDLVLTDLNMPRADGRAVLAAGKKHGTPVVVLTGQGTVETAVELMRSGAANFLIKPFSPDAIRVILDAAFENLAASRSGSAQVQISGGDPVFRAALDKLERAADTNATMLLLGESGTGKELAARRVHQASPRAKGPFVAVNCGAIPATLIEDELFGHKKGAYTDATHARTGHFQLADGGTIFLDEIGDMPLEFQGKLLRVLQERVIQPIGDSTARPVNVRVIAATNHDLRQMIQEGRFRADLYFRLNVVSVTMPPLRDRKSDLRQLAQQFLVAANEEHGRKVTGLGAPVLARLEAHTWPGNIRELQNVVESMVVLKNAGGELTVEDLPAEIAHPGPTAIPGEVALPADGLDLMAWIAAAQSRLIDQALARSGGKIKAAADLLRIKRTTLHEMMRRLGKLTADSDE